MRCCKYTIQNKSNSYASYNFRKCDDNVTYSQEEINANEIQFVFALEDTITTAFPNSISILSKEFVDVPTTPSQAQQPFISVWKTDAGNGTTNPVHEGNRTITLPLENTGVYDFIVDWGDGNIESITNKNLSFSSHTYSNVGTYTVRIGGKIKGWNFYNFLNTDEPLTYRRADKILEIKQWGCLEISDYLGQFYACRNLDLPNVSDTPILTGVTTFNRCFVNCTNLTTIKNVEKWNTSKITDLSYTFGATKFNGNIGTWDISNVTSLNYLFFSNYFFNYDINNWDTKKVKSMLGTFLGSTFNKPLNRWNLSACTNMATLFYSSSFNQDISNWDVRNVQNMNNLFLASPFSGDVSNWDVSNVTDMSGMFSSAPNFNSPIGNWGAKTSKVRSMYQMFYNASKFNQPINDWDTSLCKDMGDMFRGASSFDQELSFWNVTGVTNMNGMFRNATKFNKSINNWSPINVTDMSYMFQNAVSFSGSLSSWSTSVQNVKNMDYMFANSNYNASGSLRAWNTLSLSSMTYCFSNTPFNQSLSLWKTDKVTAAGMVGVFYQNSVFNQSLSTAWCVQNIPSEPYNFGGLFSTATKPNWGQWITRCTP